MSDLVKRLAEGEHKVCISRAEKSAKELKDMIDREYVLVKFTETKGGTELGVSLDHERSKLDADFEEGTGEVTIVGTLNLDYVDVRCWATVDVSTMEGTGHLEILEDEDEDDEDGEGEGEQGES